MPLIDREMVLAGDFHDAADIYSILLGLHDGSSRLNLICSLLEEMCHISPLIRPAPKDIRLKLLQIIDSEIEGEASDFIPVVDDIMETTDKQSPDKIFSDGTDSDSVAKVGNLSNQSSTQVYHLNEDTKIERTNTQVWNLWCINRTIVSLHEVAQVVEGI